MPIRRDGLGIICQHSPDNPAYMDGGDSAMRTGLMAMCGSTQDQELLWRFEVPVSKGILVRHPKKTPWDNPYNFTRDQLIMYMAGLYVTNTPETRAIAVDVFNQHEKRNFRCQNTEYEGTNTLKTFPDGPDLLSPADVYFLAKCAGLKDRYNSLRYKIIGLAWLALSILVATKINPDGEQNQMIAQCFVAGGSWLRLYKALHSDYTRPLRLYWSGWRDQPEIALELIALVERESRQS